MSEAASLASTLLGFAPGAVGGVCNVFVGHPIDLVKVRQQTAITQVSIATTSNSINSSSKALPMLRNIFLQQGVTGLYAGVTAPLVAVVPAFAVSFASYDFAKQRLLNQRNSSSRSYDNLRTDNNHMLTINETAAAGAFSGIFLACVLGPLERIKCLMQVRPGYYKSMTDCVKQVYQSGGVRGLFKGTSLTLMRDVPGNAVYFATYETVQRYAPTSTSMPLMTTLLAGGLAGVTNWVVAIPMDVIKSQWQTILPINVSNKSSSSLQSQQFTHWSQLARHLVQTRGPTALIQGLGPALARAFPANAACLLGVESMRKVIGVSTQ